MTKISFYTLIVLGFSAFLSSCQIEKQYHSGGFKISGPQWGIFANKGQSSNKVAISPDQNQRDFQNISKSSFYKTNGNSAKSTTSSLSYFSNKSSHVFPPDTVIIYDTVFEEEVLIIPDSIKIKHDAMLLKSQELREKSLLPTVGGYVLLMIGSIGVFLSAIVAAFSFGQAITAALLILAGSLIVLLFSGLSISKGMKMESEARMLAKKAKALITPFEAPKPKTSKTKKSNKKLLIGILIGYVILQFGAAILSAL